MIIREKYINPIRSFYDSDLIKVIIGIRRSGKSIILETIKKEISEKTDNIIYLNFEKTSDFIKVSTAKELVDYVNENRKEGKCYIFLDEVQEVEDWQKALKDLRLTDASIFVTGSNSKLLSSEILELLSGRFVSFQVRPFVYKEIFEYSKETNIEITPTNYLIWGGFPARLVLNNQEAVKAYLEDLEATIVINDLIKRYKIRKIVAFKKIVNFILMNNARIYSARSIYKYIKTNCEDVSLNTVLKYIEYLKEAFVISEIKEYSHKSRKELAFFGKVYNADVSFNSLKVMNNRFDLDHNLENIVYNELIYMGYDLKIYNNNGKEIDFVATKDGKKYFIQVAYSVVDEKAYDREFGAFKDLDNLHQKILISCDEIDFSTSTIKHIKYKDFLMLNEL